MKTNIKFTPGGGGINNRGRKIPKRKIPKKTFEVIGIMVGTVGILFKVKI